MSNDSKFYISISTIFCLTIVLVVFISTTYWKDHNSKIVDMIGTGIDPVAVMCAMQNDYGNMPVCLVLATNRAMSTQQ